MEKYYAKQKADRDSVWFRLVLQSLKTIQNPTENTLNFFSGIHVNK